jgi:hypothetical protein
VHKRLILQKGNNKNILFIIESRNGIRRADYNHSDSAVNANSPALHTNHDVIMDSIDTMDRSVMSTAAQQQFGSILTASVEETAQVGAIDASESREFGKRRRFQQVIQVGQLASAANATEQFKR